MDISVVLSNQVKVSTIKSLECVRQTIHLNQLCFLVADNIFNGNAVMFLKKQPSEGVSPPCARGSVRYSARFHRFSYSSSNLLWQLQS